MKGASEHAIQSVAEARDYKDDQSPEIASLDQMNHDERDENHPQQSELVGCCKDVGELQAGLSPVCDSEPGSVRPLANRSMLLRPSAGSAAIIPQNFFLDLDKAALTNAPGKEQS